MDTDQINVERLLRENGFYLARTKRHRVWKNAEGKIWVTPATASDHHAFKNNLEQLKRFLAHGVAKFGTFTLHLSAEERSRAEAKLHPARPAKIKTVRERRLVQKRLPRLVTALPPTTPSRPRATPTPPVRDYYKLGRAIDAALRAVMSDAWYSGIANGVKAARRQVLRNCEEMKQQGATAAEAVAYHNHQRLRVMAGVQKLERAYDPLVASMVRIFQRVARDSDNWTANTDLTATVLNPIIACIHRFVPEGRAKSVDELAYVAILAAMPVLATFLGFTLRELEPDTADEAS